uniref:Replication-associated protein n=1 Tax=Sclerotinia sclerotiorum umbra-like virus 1-U TaxID=2879910 RepID=A0A8K1YSE2_9TOMB|nr:replication-associated protein [Sclerotinia sclerotiorum umbra-like virus 1-U]
MSTDTKQTAHRCLRLQPQVPPRDRRYLSVGGLTTTVVDWRLAAHPHRRWWLTPNDFMMFKFLWRNKIESTTPDPIESFAASAFSLDHDEGRHTPVVRLPKVVPPVEYVIKDYLQGSSGRWDVPYMVYPPLSLAEQPAPPDVATSTDVDVGVVEGEVKGRVVVRLPAAKQVRFDGRQTEASTGSASLEKKKPSREFKPSTKYGPSVLENERGELRDAEFGFRLRKRGRLTRLLESIAKRDVSHQSGEGGKTSEQPARHWLGLITRWGGKLTVTQRVKLNNTDKDEPSEDCYMTVRIGGSVLAASARLLAGLVVSATNKRRTRELQLALTAKARQIATASGMTDSYLAMVLAGTVALAMRVSGPEQMANESLGGVSGRQSQRASEDIHAGRTTSLFRQFTRAVGDVMRVECVTGVVLPRATT